MFDKEFIDESLGQMECKLLIVKDLETESYAVSFLKKYLKSKKTKNVIGFDLEFNTPPGSKGQRTIGIFQIAFYLKDSVLVIFYNPHIVTNSTNQLFIQLLTAPNIYKIGHGTDSLDIPAIYSYLGSSEKIWAFTVNLFDTRFFCEYENVITKEKLCNIYWLLEKFQAISTKQLQWLKSNETKLGEFWNKKIDILNLSPELRDYSMYDALYLKKLLVKIKNHFKSSNLNFKLVVQTTQLVFLLKREIIKLYNTNYLNLCFLKDKTRLYDRFSQEYNNWLLHLNDSESGILRVNYFKNQLIRILTHGYYLIVLGTHSVYKSHHQIITYEQIKEVKNEWNELVKQMKHFKCVYKIILSFLNFCKSNLQSG
jgi:hypothetical protein